MIHTLHSISIRQYSIVDDTGDLSLLKRWYNPLPVKWFNTDKFFTDYRDLFGSNNKRELRNEVYRLLSYNKITSLDRMLKMISLIMRNQNERSLFSLLFKKEVKEYKGNLDFYIKRVKEITGIEIKDLNDLKKLGEKTQFLLDKYIERFNNKSAKEVKKTVFMDFLLSVFEIMEMQYQPEMKLWEFGRLKKRADKKIVIDKKKKTRQTA